jgi:serine/threonine-protein kinase
LITGLDVVFDFHRYAAELGWVAVDFYDGSMIYDFATQTLRLIDLDHYRDRPFTNEMGRMFGSARFMAPEEFELGAIIDEVTNVFTMGRVISVFLSDGTLESPPFRSGRSLYEVMIRACQPTLPFYKSVPCGVARRMRTYHPTLVRFIEWSDDRNKEKNSAFVEQR